MTNRSPENIFEHCALVPEGYNKKDMELAYSNLMTTSIDTKELDPEEHVKRGRKSLNPLNHKFLSPAKTLSSILEKHRIPIVDLLSIDLEEYEIEALKGANLESGKIRNIVIE